MKDNEGQNWTIFETKANQNKKPNVGFNYFLHDESGQPIGTTNRDKIGQHKRTMKDKIGQYLKRTRTKIRSVLSFPYVILNSLSLMIKDKKPGQIWTK